VSPQAFERFYEALAARTSASLFVDPGRRRGAGAIPAAGGDRHQARRLDRFWTNDRTQSRGRPLHQRFGVDRLERRFVVRKLAGFPLYVGSSLETRISSAAGCATWPAIWCSAFPPRCFWWS